MIFANEYYHILNRGNDRNTIFFEKENYHFFLLRLQKYRKRYGPKLIAYCLMPNHFHLILHEKNGGSIHRCMHALGTSYTKAINKRYQRTGHLFQGPFKKVRIKTNNQLLHLSRYIHLNPVEADIVKQPENWEHSSYREYVGLRCGNDLQMDIILKQFNEPYTYSNFVMNELEDENMVDLRLE